MHKRRAKRFRIHYPRRSSKTGEISWKPGPRPRQENRPTEQDTGCKTVLWRTSDNVPICFHCGRPGLVTRYCRDRRRVLSAARQRRQLDQYERWNSPSVSDYGRDPESNYHSYRRADYSVVSEQLRTQLRMPMFSEHNPILRTACGKVVEAIGRCMLQILGVLITLPDNIRRR
ncbi:CCHC-type domain-containing protein [Trichonephila clavipes]|nr:CCHC-type domain-containing protein [Trichonephila clavipes]